MLLWYPLYLCLIYINTGVGYESNKKCDKGQYKSDYLSGGCAQCPRRLKQCEDQEIDDARRCFIACRRIFSTTLTPFDLKPSHVRESLPHSSTTQAPKTRMAFGNLSKRPHNDTFKEKVIVSTSTEVQSVETNDKNMTDIYFGIAVSILALLLVLGVSFVFWWKRRNFEHTQQRPSSAYYSAVHTTSNQQYSQNGHVIISGSRCSGEPSINSQTSGNADEVVQVQEDESVLSMASVSHEDLENMMETHV